MKTILLNVYENEMKTMEIEPNLFAYYKALGCDGIEIVERKIGGKLFEVMCDEMGIYREDQKISAINSRDEPVLVGNLLFFKSDGAGGLIGLDDDELVHIRKHVKTMCTYNHPEGYIMLTQCD